MVDERDERGRDEVIVGILSQYKIVDTCLP